jgi:hypothetical protein
MIKVNARLIQVNLLRNNPKARVSVSSPACTHFVIAAPPNIVGNTDNARSFLDTPPCGNRHVRFA